MRYRFLFFTLPCIFLSVLLHGQKSWTLKECIDYAHNNNLQIKRTELQADIANNNYNQSVTNLLPSVNAGFERSFYYGRYLDDNTNDIYDNNSVADNLRVSGSVNLFSGFKNINKMKQQKSNLLACLQDVEKEKVDITMNIATAYLEILFQKELLQVTLNQKETTRLQVERTKKLVEAGSLAKGNLFEIQAQLANEKLNAINYQNSLKLATLNLVQLLDLDSLSGFDIDFSDTVNIDKLPVLASASDIYYEALVFMPHIKSAEYQVKSSESNLKVQKGGLSPTVYINGSLATKYSSNQEDRDDQDYRDQMDINFYKYMEVGVSIPIFNKWQVKTNINNAKIQVNDTKYALEQTQQQLYKNIQQAHNDAMSAQEQYNAAQEAVNSYKEAFHYTEQKYNVGIVNSVDYNIAKNNLIKAESELLQAKYSYIFSVKILDLYRGVPITL